MQHDGKPLALARPVAVSGVVDAAEVDHLLETVRLQPFTNGFVLRRGNFDGQLAEPLGRIEVLDRVEELLQPWRHRAMVFVLLILFCSWTMPYSSASAVGG